MMVKEEKIVVDKKPSSFPKLVLLVSVIGCAVAIISLLNLVEIPKIVLEVLLLLIAAWLFLDGFAKGVYKNRAEKLKKYL